MMANAKNNISLRRNVLFQIHNRTPFHFVADSGHLEVVIYFIENGAELNLIWDSKVLNHPTTFFIFKNNFTDPHFRNIKGNYGAINWKRLVENGMIGVFGFF